MIPRKTVLAVGLVTCTLVAPGTTATPPPQSAIPDTFSNLQVLPKDISKQNMVNIMRLFSIAIGQRCSFCHVATDDLSKADFAADDKETKRKTRDLLKAILEAQKASAK